MNHHVALGFLVIACLVVSSVSAAPPAPPALPMTVRGASVTIDGIPAPVGTVVSVTGTGVVPASVTLDVAGTFGGPGPFDPNLVVQGTITPGETVEFMINGVPADQVAVYYSGATIAVDLSTGGQEPGEKPVVLIPQADPTPASTVPPTLVPTVSLTPVPTFTPAPIPTLISFATSATQPLPLQVPDPACPATGFYEVLPTSVVTDNPIPLRDCPDIPRFVPPGYGALYVGAWGSEAKFYLNGVIISNGGPMTLKGIPPGNYTVAYRETGYEPQDIPVTIGPDRFVMVRVNPREMPLYGWDPECISPKYTDMADRTAGYGQISECLDIGRGPLIYIDGEVLVGCGPVDVTLTPGIHQVRIEVDKYFIEYPVFIGAGTTLAVHGGSPISAISCGRFFCKYTPSGAVYRGIV